MGLSSRFHELPGDKQQTNSPTPLRLDIRVSQLISLVERWSGRSRTKPSPMVRRILAAPPTARQGGCRGGDARQKSSAYEREARFEALGGHRGGSRKVICLACSEGRNRASFSLFIYHLGSTRPQHRGGPSRRRQQAAWHTHADIIGRAKPRRRLIYVPCAGGHRVFTPCQRNDEAL